MTSLDTGALLALWNDIETARIAEYDAWHTIEHVPERVSVPGYVCATRFVSPTQQQARYFTLYELESLSCLDSAAYRELVDVPTPWSISMRPSFRNFMRATYNVVGRAGSVRGAGLVFCRAVAAAGVPQISNERLSESAGQLLSDSLGICATRCLVARRQDTGPAALRNVDPAPAGQEILLLLETAWPDSLDEAQATLQRAAAPLLQASIWQQAGGYRYASHVTRDELAPTGRPTPRTDLMKKLQTQSNRP